jgi:hypothetical protein
LEFTSNHPNIMETTIKRNSQSSVIRVRYQHGSETLLRCFTIVGGELEKIECPPHPREIIGVGDAVAAATKAVGVKPCGGCAKRQAALNRATPGWLSRILLRSSQLVDRLRARVWKR